MHNLVLQTSNHQTLTPYKSGIIRHMQLYKVTLIVPGTAVEDER